MFCRFFPPRVMDLSLHLEAIPEISMVLFNVVFYLQPPAEVRANFPKIDAIVLFGEPTRWETSLQLLIDILLTDGKLTNPICEFADGKSHLPILACNMDLLWMSDSHMPR